MRKMYAILIFIVLSFGADAQTILQKEISLDIRDVTLKKAIKAIERVSGLKFVYSRNRLNLDEKVTIQCTEKKLGEVLDELFDPRTIKHTLQPSNDYVVLSVPKNLGEWPANPVNSTGQDKALKIAGVVKDKNGEALPGVHVLVKGTSIGTTTDANGLFTTEVADESLLVFTYIGYKSVERLVIAEKVIDVVMEEDVNVLNQVVVNAGYWQVKKNTATGNIIKIEEESIQKQPVTNTIQALIGRIPGIYVQQTSGVPGAAFKMFFRGSNNLPSDQNNIPLYIVDGVPFTSASLSIGIGDQIITNGTSPLNNLNLADIASIEILKDADATAIFGSRGANGVILVTTKKGRPGKTTTELNMYQGISTVTNHLNLLGRKQWLTMRKEAFSNDNATPGTYDYDLNDTWDTTRQTNWLNKLTGKLVNSTNMHASLTGGTSTTSFIITAGHYKESSSFMGKDFNYQRGSVHFNLRHNWNEKLSVDFTAGYYFDTNVLPRYDLTKPALALSPVAPAIYDSAGNINWANSTWINPLFYVRQVYTTNTSDLLSNLALSYNVNKSLAITAHAGYSKLSMNELATIPNAALNPAQQSTGETYKGDSELRTWIIEPVIAYNKQLANGAINIVAGGTYQQIVESGTVINATGYTNDEDLMDFSKATSLTSTKDRDSLATYTSIFGRFNYQLKEKYYFNVTGRRDGNDGFPDQNFGAVGLGWIFSRETSLPWIISFGKLRASYGYSGWAGLISDKFEAATDWGFFNNRIQLYLTWYHNLSSNKISESKNHIIIRNSGWEAEMNTINISRDNFVWKTYGNFTIPKSILVQYPGLENSVHAHTLAKGKSIFVTGRYHVSGVNKETGIYSIQDVDNNGSFTEDDYIITRPVTQELYGGIGNEIRYKAFQLDVFFQVVKQTGFNYMTDFSNQPGSLFTNQPAWVMNRWHNPEEVSGTQKFSQNFSMNMTYLSVAKLSDYTIVDASFVRLKNVSLSLNFKSAWLKKMKMQQGKVYIQGQNLLTLTNGFKGTDPENQNNLVLAPLRTLSIGFKFTL